MKHHRPSHWILNVLFAVASIFLLFEIGVIFHGVSRQTAEELPPEGPTPQWVDPTKAIAFVALLLISEVRPNKTTPTSGADEEAEAICFDSAPSLTEGLQWD